MGTTGFDGTDDLGSVTLGTDFLADAFAARAGALLTVGESFGGFGSAGLLICAGAFWGFCFSTFEVLPFCDFLYYYSIICYEMSREQTNSVTFLPLARKHNHIDDHFKSEEQNNIQQWHNNRSYAFGEKIEWVTHHKEPIQEMRISL